VLAKCQFKVIAWGYHVYLWHGTSVCWHMNPWLESGPVTADMTTTVVYSYKLPINVKSLNLFTLSLVHMFVSLASIYILFCAIENNCVIVWFLVSDIVSLSSK